MSGQPYVGQVVYLDQKATMPMKVSHVEGTLIWMVPTYTDFKTTHKGNVYNANGEGEWVE